VMAARGRRTRAKWIAILCALAAIAVGVAGTRHVIRFVRESRAIAALRSEDEAERKDALQELAKLRSVRGVQAILSTMGKDEKIGRALMGWRSDSSWEALCARMVSEVGLHAIPILRSKLASPDAGERFWSIFFLMGFPEHGQEDRLLSLFEDVDWDVRVMAANAVGVSAAKSPRLLQRLVVDLGRKDSSEALRVTAAVAINAAADPAEEREHFGLTPGTEFAPRDSPSPETMTRMRSAASVLLEAAEDPSEDLRDKALMALCTLRRRVLSSDPDLENSIHAIIRRGLSHPDISRRRTTLFWIQDAYDFDPEGDALPRDVLEILGTLLADEKLERALVDGYGYLTGPWAIPVLLRVMEEDNPLARSRAKEILESVAQPETWSAIFEYAVRPDGSIRDTAVDLLVSVGGVDGIGTDRLSVALASKEPASRRAAVRILARYHASGSVEASILLPLLLDDDEEVVSHAAAALSSSGNLTADAFETRVLKLLAASKPVPVRLAACRTARGLGPKAIEAVPALVSAAQGEDSQLAAEAIAALSVISPEESIPLSIRGLSHEDRGIRDAAVTALWSIGSAAAPALSALRKLAEDKKDLDLATRATTLVRRLEAEEGRSSRVPR